MFRTCTSLFFVCAAAGVAAALLGAGPGTAADMPHTSRQFHGAKVNGGTVTHMVSGMSHTLTLSNDFAPPDSPAPHWQIVDSSGHAYLLQRLLVKGPSGDVLNRTITIPSYIPDIASVQIWCAWAETLLGETTFDRTVMLRPMSSSPGNMQTSTPFMGVKADSGTVTFSREGGRRVLTLSSDFKVPDSPAPHWQLVDSRGNAYLLQRLVIKGDTFHSRITVPAYVPDVAKVQIWCSYAEVLLGEASFPAPVT
jgi:hypothetical protein